MPHLVTMATEVVVIQEAHKGRDRQVPRQNSAESCVHKSRYTLRWRTESKETRAENVEGAREQLRKSRHAFPLLKLGGAKLQ